MRTFDASEFIIRFGLYFYLMETKERRCLFVPLLFVSPASCLQTIFPPPYVHEGYFPPSAVKAQSAAACWPLTSIRRDLSTTLDSDTVVIIVRAVNNSAPPFPPSVSFSSAVSFIESGNGCHQWTLLPGQWTWGEGVRVEWRQP